MELRVDLDDIRWNVRSINTRYDQEIVPVLKAISCDMKIADVIGRCTSGVGTMAGVNIKRLELLREHLNYRVMSLRPTTLPVAANSPHIDVFSMSDWEGIKTLDSYCGANQYEQQIYLMVDVGESREGIEFGKVPDYVEMIRDLNNLELKALAANPGCHTGVVDVEKIEELCDLAEDLGVERVSGGSTALLAEDIPDRVDELRIGEGLLTGKHAVEAETIPGLKNPFTARASVVKDRGKLVLYDMGSETTNIDSLYNGPNVVGAWSDMALVEDSGASYGDIQEWKVGYWGVVRAYDSPDVRVVYA